MISDDHLIGWLVMLRLSFGEERICSIPEGITAELERRGWLARSHESDWEGAESGTITDAGKALCDLHGPDWGVSTIPVEDS